ncbi:hypothetical protein MF672_011665 [Actinomadura sp. ATCC 31491]|uniref:WD40 repeat domain-containing protein n=1 Tax=Actinomadura luzonensis TaxID=2805427 RepID=A0ABT0FQ48_9ACTN|nr:hypothetical protein [Actinomadura luzonensis]MCK2214442.1 hypothetical protein [Actinomadura luzonensis]
MRGEQDLVRTLRAAADQVEPLDLTGGVAARRRARRGRRRATVALAAAAVVAVAGGTTAALSGEARRVQPATTVSPSSSPSPQASRPAEELWPRAMATVAARRATGALILPVTALSPTELLLFVPGEPARLDVYDIARRATTATIAELSAIKGATRLGGVAVGPRHVAWYGGTDKSTTFWIAPRAGGTATRVATVPGPVAAFDVTADALVWSPQGGGVYRMPLTGGKPARVPGGDGLTLTAWPWATHRDRNTFANDDRVADLASGRSYDVRAPEGTRFLRCDGRWCVGDLKGRLVAQRPDGTGRHVLPDLRMYSVRPPYAGRYALTAPTGEPEAGGPLAVLYDLETGTRAGLGTRTSATAARPVTGSLLSVTATVTALFWGDADPPKKEWTVLDLLAVTG